MKKLVILCLVALTFFVACQKEPTTPIPGMAFKPLNQTEEQILLNCESANNDAEMRKLFPFG